MYVRQTNMYAERASYVSVVQCLQGIGLFCHGMTGDGKHGFSSAGYIRQDLFFEVVAESQGPWSM